MTLQEFLAQLDEPLVTEDVLSSILPLVREVIQAHRAGCVGPLEGLADLQVDGMRIWFEEARRQPPRRNETEVARIDQASRVAVEVLAESRRTTDVGQGEQQSSRVEIGSRGLPLERPVYLPGYVAWEHEAGHHDPVTDVFSLGLVLASLACGINLNEPTQLEQFVNCRRNLFQLNPNLHPALAQAILRMTELDRRRRPQDLSALLTSLENYRDQAVPFEIDLARLPGLQSRDPKTKAQAVLMRLRDRLFDISRRNSLLHFRPSMGTVNLTQASIPLLLDIRNIREDQILVWGDKLQQQLVDGKPISLSRYLNFAEAVYLPSLLERIIGDARRDQHEYGMAQLRLVICFLSWANLKEKPAECFVSPLVLLPVKLTKTKGIKDTYHLEALSSEAEINPVLRHQFRQLYNINLPETLDLAQGGLDPLLEYLTGQIRASEPSVTVNRIDRPRIDLIHEKAKRRLDLYRRNARVSGRGVRSLLDIDYSYDPANYHPLGIKLFAAKVRTPTSRLREILEQKPRPRAYMRPSDKPMESAPEPASAIPIDPTGPAPAQTKEPPPDVVETEKSFFHIRDASEDNPYLWNFDLCSLTLANFRYRRMSLVRDYEAIVDDGSLSPAFEGTFSLSPRPVGRELPPVPPLAERFDVVPCDPTQAIAIAEARRGVNYIIQGPPGTGKSQTITNLIADFVARGQRVLFVCEKRAAIDVVFARLRQCGLAPLCCLIHDSQSDKKDFVLDLKQTYEALLEPKSAASKTSVRDEVLRDISRELAPLAHFETAMEEEFQPAGLPARKLLDRCLSLAEHRPTLTPEEAERLPYYVAWWPYQDQLAALDANLRDLCSDGVLARHPLRLLSPHLAEAERPMEAVAGGAKRGAVHLDSLLAALQKCGIPADQWNSLARARELVEYAQRVEPVARDGNFSLTDERSERAAQFAQASAEVAKADASLAAAKQAAAAWQAKLTLADLATALEQVRGWEGRFFAWLSPSWWRMRSVLNRSYNFRAHAVQPTWTQILTLLQREYDAATASEQARLQTIAQFSLNEPLPEFASRLHALRPWLAARPEWLRRIHAALLKSPKANEILQRVLAAASPLSGVDAELATILVDYKELSLTSLKESLQAIAEAARQVPLALSLLSELGHLPPEVGRALREMPLTLIQAEAAVAHRTWENLCRGDREVGRFQGKTRERHAHELETQYDRWLAANAQEIRQRVAARFLAHVQTSNVSAAQLSPAEKEFKKAYSQGRRALEHEFGKSMRYRAIRELVDGEPGLVVKDLKPVWLMSPLSVSDTLPLAIDFADVVIFDEASQVPLEDAVPSLFRGKQVIVVGDEMQLPPTDFFSSRSEEDEEICLEDGEQRVQYDLGSDSFLNHSAKNLPSTMLGWHYRSRSESLISFSNWAFYDGRLLTVPDERLPLPPEKSATPLDLLLSRPISFHHLSQSVYDHRRNRGEAEYIAGLVRDLLKQKQGHSIGVIAFSEAQQDEIEKALTRLGQEDEEFRQLYEEELQREVDGQFVGLLVKNLENIQGDERDVIILSICYGPGPTGKMLMNFGPINQSGGEKRLNVAFSRAKRFMAIVSTIRDSQITNDYNEGAMCLKNYLRYAEASSAGDVPSARRVLAGISRWREGDELAAAGNDPLCLQIAAALRSRGFLVEEGVGQSHFRVDLAASRAGDSEYRLGILTDTFTHYEQSEPLERDMMRPRLLRAFGWKVTSVLAKDWYDNQGAEIERLLELLKKEAT